MWSCNYTKSHDQYIPLNWQKRWSTSQSTWGGEGHSEPSIHSSALTTLRTHFQKSSEGGTAPSHKDFVQRSKQPEERNMYFQKCWKYKEDKRIQIENNASILEYKHGKMEKMHKNEKNCRITQSIQKEIKIHKSIQDMNVTYTVAIMADRQDILLTRHI